MKLKDNPIFLISLAYLLMITIWSTTPLAIKWSSEGVDFVTGVSLRMFIGTLLSLLLTFLLYKKLPLHRQALLVYLSSAISIFGSMMLVYWGAQYIPSGLISVLFGLTPIITSFMTFLLLRSNALNYQEIIGGLIGLLGLSIIFFEQLDLGETVFYGIAATLISVLLHAGSAVIIKRIDAQLPALAISTGGLLISMPLFVLGFSYFALPLPEVFPEKALWSIIYLGAIGSVIGFVSYYYILNQLSASAVSLATLITPVTALLIGYWFNQETITDTVFLGTGLILTGLIIHQFYRQIKQHFLPSGEP
jgi:drug/metabolite transporter (DMT)-like permease